MKRPMIDISDFGMEELREDCDEALRIKQAFCRHEKTTVVDGYEVCTSCGKKLRLLEEKQKHELR